MTEKEKIVYNALVNCARCRSDLWRLFEEIMSNDKNLRFTKDVRATYKYFIIQAYSNKLFPFWEIMDIRDKIQKEYPETRGTDLC